MVPKCSNGHTRRAYYSSQLGFAAFAFSLCYQLDECALQRCNYRPRADVGFALISILEVTLKLAVVFVLKWILFDKLITYACLTTLVALIIRTVYAVYCKRHFEESRFKFTFDKGLLCDMLGFTGWAFGEIQLSYSKTRE